jgi:hypothetical protein
MEMEGTKETPNLMVKPQPRCLEIASKGVKSGADFASMMSALMSDLIDGRITPMVGNATCNAAGKLLKVVELQHKYGTDGTENGAGKKTLMLTE